MTEREQLVREAEDLIEFLSRKTHGPCRTAKLIRRLLSLLPKEGGGCGAGGGLPIL